MFNLKKSVAAMLILVILSISVVPLTGVKRQANLAKKQEQQQVAKVIEKEQKQNVHENEIKTEAIKERVKSQQSQVSRGNLNRHEVTLLAMVVEGEAADEPYQGKVAVAAVIMNRMEDQQFPDTLSGVVYEDWAFESVMNNQYKRPLSQESINAAQAALRGEDPTNGALYFWNPATAKSKWVWSRTVTHQIGRHVFAK
ncbi:cell wall hydrolase [Desulforamulus ferrireducens]|uniref:Cell wall hydrolase n=1 Tax=Desulforamulus ferrireducens TaxID=1833852 RepID=A0A1S6IVB5_9FIRM|nr:cell wall hydrolase [Desulforamulus ferrireducens]AQS58731.1 cell wall hydrolase [Desulforamulus ferrireducens]